ncbi:MAG: hypothetical protein MHM6MM_000797 [Cercozoa sp. M6MM]
MRSWSRLLVLALFISSADVLAASPNHSSFESTYDTGSNLSDLTGACDCDRANLNLLRSSEWIVSSTAPETPASASRHHGENETILLNAAAQRRVEELLSVGPSPRSPRWNIIRTRAMPEFAAVRVRDPSFSHQHWQTEAPMFDAEVERLAGETVNRISEKVRNDVLEEAVQLRLAERWQSGKADPSRWKADRTRQLLTYQRWARSRIVSQPLLEEAFNRAVEKNASISLSH